MTKEEHIDGRVKLEVTFEDPEQKEKLLRPGKINDEGLFLKLYNGEPLTHDEIASIFGVSRVAVTNKVKKMGLGDREKLSPEEYEARLSGELMNKIQMVMQQISSDKINKASLSQLGVLLGILYDKRKQHDQRGVPEVSYVGVLHKFDQASLDQLKEVMAKETQKRLNESRQITLKQMKERMVGPRNDDIIDVKVEDTTEI